MREVEQNFVVACGQAVGGDELGVEGAKDRGVALQIAAPGDQSDAVETR